MGLFSVLAAAAASFFFGAVWYKVLIRFGTVDKAYIKKLVRQVFRSNS